MALIYAIKASHRAAGRGLGCCRMLLGIPLHGRILSAEGGVAQVGRRPYAARRGPGGRPAAEACARLYACAEVWRGRAKDAGTLKG